MRGHPTVRTVMFVFFLVIIAAGCQKTGVQAGNDNSNGTPAGAGSLPVWDQDFLSNAEKSEIRQLSLSKVALDRARGSDVQAYARMVVDDHTRTLQGLRDLMNRKGVSRPGAATEANAEGEYRLDSVSGTAAFDHEYISLMAAETEQTQSRFKQAAETADDREVRAYASAVLPVIQRERDKAADLEKKLR
jgi:putative membrane protein